MREVYIMVSTDNNPEMGVDPIAIFFKEYSAEVWIVFLAGFITGILLTCCFLYIKKMYSNDHSDDEEQ